MDLQDLEDLNKVWKIKVLKRKPCAEAARIILNRVAKQVQPLMRRRKWRVKVLSQFCNATYLGLNVDRGTEVKLRLRQYDKEWDFFQFEEILDTMLHELCHNEIDRHNASFYKLWDELRVECGELVTKGITGTSQGFDVPGRHLGGFTVHAPLPPIRQTALAAAEKRARTEAILPSGPKRLRGNSNIMTTLSPIQPAAMAAEGNMQNDLWCGSASHEISNAVESDNDIWEHTIPAERGETSKSSDVIRSAGSSSTSATENIEDKAIWECSICPVFNEPLALVCEACGTQKRKAAASKSKT